MILKLHSDFAAELYIAELEVQGKKGYECKPTSRNDLGPGGGDRGQSKQITPLSQAKAIMTTTNGLHNDELSVLVVDASNFYTEVSEVSPHLDKGFQASTILKEFIREEKATKQEDILDQYVRQAKLGSV